MTPLTTDALARLAGNGADPAIAFDLIAKGEVGEHLNRDDLDDPRGALEHLYRQGFQAEGDPMTDFPYGVADTYAAFEFEDGAVIIGWGPFSDGVATTLTWAAYEVVPADENAALVSVWWDDGSGERERGFYFDSAEDSGGFGRISPNGPHSTRHMAQLAALDLFKSARFVAGPPLHYPDA